MPSTLLVHFVEGLFDPVLTNYDFQFGEETYAVTGLIQYKGTPDHFIAWIRDVRSEYSGGTGVASLKVPIISSVCYVICVCYSLQFAFIVLLGNINKSC